MLRLEEGIGRVGQMVLMGGLALGGGGVCVSVLLKIKSIPRIPRQRDCMIAFGGLGGQLRWL